MKFYRYMGKREFDALIDGETLLNVTDHSKRKAKSTSIGFCFPPEKTVSHCTDGKTYCFSPEACYSFLLGIVTDSYLVEFKSKLDLIHSKGTYTAYSEYLHTISERCITAYNRYILVPTRYTTDFDEGTFKWKEI